MRLSVQIEFDKALDLETKKDSVVVGRAPHCDLVVNHQNISREHCRIEKIKNQFFITDLGSSNGVFVNNQRLKPHVKTEIRSGAPLALGTLECLLGHEDIRTQEKVLSVESSPRGDYTATIRIARIELNRPSITLELEKKPKLAGPKNPVSGHREEEIVVERSYTGIILVGTIIVCLLLMLYLYLT
jgi:pSer/pThr/pTyr-binding forkhead associated (FHA) protein